MDFSEEMLKHAGIMEAMNELDKRKVVIDGVQLDACNCYHYSLTPVHVLFNDNCPESLRQTIKGIFESNGVHLPLAE